MQVSLGIVVGWVLGVVSANAQIAITARRERKNAERELAAIRAIQSRVAQEQLRLAEQIIAAGVQKMSRDVDRAFFRGMDWRR